MIIFESLLTTLEVRNILWFGFVISKYWLEPKSKPPSQVRLVRISGTISVFHSRLLKLDFPLNSPSAKHSFVLIDPPLIMCLLLFIYVCVSFFFLRISLFLFSALFRISKGQKVLRSIQKFLIKFHSLQIFIWSSQTFGKILICRNILLCNIASSVTSFEANCSVGTLVFCFRNHF